MFRHAVCLAFILLLGACSSMSGDSGKVKYKDNVAVSEAEFNHDLLSCNNRYKDYLASPLVREPKSKEEYFRSCLGSLGYHEKNPSDEKKQFIFNFKEIELNLIKLGK